MKRYVPSTTVCHIELLIQYSTQFKIINQPIQQLKNKSFIQQYKLKDITKQPMIKMQTFTVPI